MKFSDQQQCASRSRLETQTQKQQQQYTFWLKREGVTE